jgi:hypothetical protein
MAMRLIYAYAFFLFLAFAASLAALIFYIHSNYYATVVSALTAAVSYLATRIIIFFIAKKEE